MSRTCSAILFDKDGTLFDFDRSWFDWAVTMLRHLARGDDDHAARVAETLGIDWHNQRFHPWCRMIHGLPNEFLDILAAEFSGWDHDTINTYLFESSRKAKMIAYFPLHPLLDFLRNSGFVLGLATNDFGQVAREQLHDHRIDHLFAYIAGSDSGYGSKPDPGMLIEFSRQSGIPPAEIAMVGDTTIDMLAARAAGMQAVAVENGLQPASELARYADHSLASIADLPAWLTIENSP
ncbi:MAG: HAD family hydrolase [Rhodobacteraceae bacterium]|nr:HAD family hydrolase [Paracoccaceae bacterium]